MNNLHRSICFQVAKDRGYKSPRDPRAKREATRVLKEIVAHSKPKEGSDEISTEGYSKQAIQL